MPYIDWEHYSSLYTNVPEDDFPAFLQKASVKLDVHTHMRARKFEDTYDEASATYFQKQVHVQIQNSESYKITTVAEKESQLISITRGGLSGTGLAGAL